MPYGKVGDVVKCVRVGERKIVFRSIGDDRYGIEIDYGDGQKAYIKSKDGKLTRLLPGFAMPIVGADYVIDNKNPLRITGEIDYPYKNFTNNTKAFYAIKSLKAFNPNVSPVEALIFYRMYHEKFEDAKCEQDAMTIICDVVDDALTPYLGSDYLSKYILQRNAQTLLIALDKTISKPLAHMAECDSMPNFVKLSVDDGKPIVLIENVEASQWLKDNGIE